MAFNTKESIAEQIQQNTKYEYKRWLPTEWSFSDADLPTDFTIPLYRNLTAVVDKANIDFTRPSAEKWSFACFLMEELASALDSVSQEVFTEVGYKREDILFSVSMSDGDYMDEMFLDSIKK